MKDFERKLRRSKELSSIDFGDSLLRDKDPGYDLDSFRLEIGDFSSNNIFRKTKKKIIILSIVVLYFIIASIIGTITILKTII